VDIYHKGTATNNHTTYKIREVKEEEEGGMANERQPKGKNGILDRAQASTRKIIS
jgi:hypothetical protein